MSIKNFYFYVVVIVCFSFISKCLADPNDLPYKEGELLIRFIPKAEGIKQNTNEQNQILSALNAGEVKRSYNIVPGLTLIKLPDNLKVEDALVQLKDKNEFVYVEPNWKIKLDSIEPNDPNFEYVEPDWILHLGSREPNDQHFNLQWGLHNTGQGFHESGDYTGAGTEDADIDAPEAWDVNTVSSIIVAVIDTGIDYTHPDLVPTAFLPSVRTNFNYYMMRIAASGRNAL